jgi:hypothetical protein
MKHLVGKVITKKYPFMDDEVEVRKLSVAEVFKVQALVKKSSKKSDEASQLALLRDVIRLAVVGAHELSDEEFDEFPLGELSELSNNVLNFSGLSGESAGN